MTLDQYYALLLASINYQIEKEKGSQVCDGKDFIVEFMEGMKKQVRAEYENQDIDRLRDLWERDKHRFRLDADLKFGPYIREQTGHDPDLFAGIESQVKEIIARGKILAEEEMEIVEIQYEIDKQVSLFGERVEVLHALLVDYYNAQPEEPELAYQGIMMRKVEKNGKIKMVEVNVSSEQPIRPMEEHLIYSPDGKKKIRIHQYPVDEGEGHTYVNIVFSDGNHILAYAVKALQEITASWIDDQSVVVEIPEGGKVLMQHYLIERYGETVRVSYAPRAARHV